MKKITQIVITLLIGVVPLVSCGGSGSAPSPVTPPVIPPIATVEGLAVSPSVAHAGDIVAVTFSKLTCTTGFLWGVRYAREDGQVYPIGTSNCPVGPTTSGIYATKLVPQNNLLFFTQGQGTITADLVVMEVFPTIVWTARAGTFVVQ